MSAAIGSSGLAMATSLTAALSFAVMSVGGEAHTREHSSRAKQSRAGQSRAEQSRAAWGPLRAWGSSPVWR